MHKHDWFWNGMIKKGGKLQHIKFKGYPSALPVSTCPIAGCLFCIEPSESS